MRTTRSDLDISVVVLCYRAEEFVPVFVTRMKDALEREGLSYELILIANYHPHASPPDRTPEIVRELARHDPRLIAVTRPKEGMMGWDMRSGFAVASGKTVAVIDGDGQMTPEDVIAVHECLCREGCDLAKAWRMVRHDGALRRIVSRAYNITLRCLFPRVTVHDANGKPKIFTREALAKLSLQSDAWFIDAEIIIQASARGFRIGEVPTVFLANERRPSFITAQAILGFAGELLFYRLKTLGRAGFPSTSN